MKLKCDLMRDGYLLELSSAEANEFTKRNLETLGFSIFIPSDVVFDSSLWPFKEKPQPCVIRLDEQPALPMTELPQPAPVCHCGADITRTLPHSHWCPKASVNAYSRTA
jgi:hypothetical protein